MKESEIRCSWTKQEEEILKAMAGGGAIAEDIMEVLKSRSMASIRSKAKMMQVSLMGPSPEIDETAFKRFLKERGK